MMYSSGRMIRILAVLCLMFIGVMSWALQAGSVSLPLLDLGKDALHGRQAAHLQVFWQILLELRVPRVVSAFCVGGLLSMAGLLLQVLLRNPLADPYILGVSGGAGLGAVTTLWLWPAAVAVSSFVLPMSAALGALVVIVGVFVLASSGRLDSVERLLLVGVAVSSLCTAWIALILSFSEAERLRGMMFWLLGELDSSHVWVLVSAWLVLLLVIWPLGRTLNVLLLGPDVAFSLGVSVQNVRRMLYWLSALSTGVAVSAGGMIGFVGLVVPHACRLVIGTEHRLLLPVCAVVGGCFLVLADGLARTVLAPVQLPVGVVTALIGAPVFIVLLSRR